MAGWRPAENGRCDRGARADGQPAVAVAIVTNRTGVLVGRGDIRLRMFQAAKAIADFRE